LNNFVVINIPAVSIPRTPIAGFDYSAGDSPEGRFEWADFERGVVPTGKAMPFFICWTP
jgi:hypothetical protein